MKRLIALTMCAVSLGAAAQLPDYVPADGLVAWFPLDGDANDVGPNQFVSQLSGTTAYEGHLGNDGGALWFEGDAFVHSPFSTLSTEQGVTYTAWVQRADSPGIGYIVGYGNSNELGQSFCLAEGDSYGLFATAIGSSYDAKSNQLLPSNEWTFVATTILNNEVSIYMNNQVVFDDTIQQPSFQLDGDMWIGVSPFNQGQAEFWEGAIDDVGVWNRALSVEEIQEVYIGTPPSEGCTDESACNYDATAMLDDESCLQLDACGECGGDSTSGCTDSYACNFDAEAACDDGSCDYSCCPGPGCCTEGMYWDWELSGCYNINPADINFDGCVQLNDLLDLLSAYGDCGDEESAWQCGDPLEYQGYDYETVQIGEQCWFAENLRAENYRNEDEILSGSSGNEWQNLSIGASAIYGESDDCEEAEYFSACDLDQSLVIFGRLYNWFAVGDFRGLCPTSWHVPTDDEWYGLDEILGGGNNTDEALKSTVGWNSDNGTNSSGFRALPSGKRDVPGGDFTEAGSTGGWWSSTEAGASNIAPLGYAWTRLLKADEDALLPYDPNKKDGFSVRCIKDAE